MLAALMLSVQSFQLAKVGGKLYLHDNQVSDLSALKDLTSLKELGITNNPVVDYSPVSFVENLIGGEP